MEDAFYVLWEETYHDSIWLIENNWMREYGYEALIGLGRVDEALASRNIDNFYSLSGDLGDVFYALNAECQDQ